MEKTTEKVSWRETWSIYKRAVRLLRRYTPGLFSAVTASAAVTGVTPYAGVYLSARVLEELAGARRPAALWRWTVLTVAVTGALALAGHALERRKNAHYQRFFEDRKRIYTDKLLDMDFEDVASQRTRDLLAQIRQDENWAGLGLQKTPYLYELILKQTIGVASAVALCAGLFAARVPASAGLLTILDGPAGLLGLLAAIAVPTAASSWLWGVVHRMDQNEATAESATLGNRIFGTFGFSFGEDTFRALDVRMYGQERIARRYMAGNLIYSADGPFGKLAAGRVGLLNGLSAALSGLPTGAVYLYVCLKAWAGAFGVGLATQYIGAVTALTGNVRTLLRKLSEARNNAFFIRIAYAFLDIPNAMYQGSLTTEKRADRQYDVEFRDVSFHYPGSENWALKNVSVKFKVGSRLAIVGENGSGKTTFIKLLCRLYDPQEGQILLNGIDIRKYNYRDYMDIFSVVFQDFQLLSQPLGANVAGSMDYDRERVRKALTDAGFGERLASLPDGLDTQLYRDYDGEGIQISGGEAQKIAIARALYKDAPFIILDEPTAALDPMAEAEIYAKFNQISGDRTAVYISHRLSSCRFCDEILVFDGGQIVQHGTHDGLLADTGGKYAALWHAQAQYYTE